MRITKPVARELLYEAILFVVPTAQTALLYEHNLLLASVHMATGLLAVALWPPFRSLRFFLLGMVAGPVFELPSIHAGAWHYANPSFLGIPVWLPLAWGWMAMLLRTIAGTLAKMGGGHGGVGGASKAADPC